MELRPYQTELIQNIREEIKKGHRAVVAVLGCGGGKSVIQAMIAKSATDRGNRVLFIVHRKELCAQIADTFVRCGVDLNLCRIQMVQTVARRLGQGSWEPSVIITDECHHALSNSYMKIYEYYKKALRLGFTATPVRLNYGGLGEVFESMVTGVTTSWLIEHNYLAPYEYYSVKLVNTDKLKTRAGEYISSDVSELMEQRYIYGEVLKTYHKKAEGKKTIIYCASIEASKNTIEEFRKEGIRAAHLDGKTNENLRAETIRRFRNGEIDVLSNVDLFGEGFDVPDCECVILLRPTMSLTLHIQQSMRSMRYKEGKTAIIIDHVGNVYRHGLPDDDREWTLEANKKKQQSEVKVKECPICFTILKNTEKRCYRCGHIFDVQQRETETPENIEAELERIRAEDLKNLPYNDYKKCTSFEQMENFRKAKKYKFMWTLRKCIELGIPVPDKYHYMVRRFIG